MRNPGSYNLHLNFRKAVAHAIDKDKIVDEILEGQVEPMSSYIDAFSPTLSGGAGTSTTTTPPSRIEYLAALCAEEGVDCAAMPPKAVFTTTSNNAARVLLSELFVEMFADGGIDYEAQLEDSSLFFGETSTTATSTWASGRGSAPRGSPAWSRSTTCSTRGYRRPRARTTTAGAPPR